MPCWLLTACDRLNLKWNQILEEHMIEKCTILVDDMSKNMGPNCPNNFFIIMYLLFQDMSRNLGPKSWKSFPTILPTDRPCAFILFDFETAHRTSVSSPAHMLIRIESVVHHEQSLLVDFLLSLTMMNLLS